MTENRREVVLFTSFNNIAIILLDARGSSLCSHASMALREEENNRKVVLFSPANLLLFIKLSFEQKIGIINF